MVLENKVYISNLKTKNAKQADKKRVYFELKNLLADDIAGFCHIIFYYIFHNYKGKRIKKINKIQNNKQKINVLSNYIIFEYILNYIIHFSLFF
jgi:hypothetical protein